MPTSMFAFDGLMTAYRLPKSSEDEKSRRAAAIQSSLRAATDTPLACARACAEVVALSKRAGEKGYAGVISDAEYTSKREQIISEL